MLCADQNFDVAQVIRFFRSKVRVRRKGGGGGAETAAGRERLRLRRSPESCSSTTSWRKASAAAPGAWWRCAPTHTGEEAGSAGGRGGPPLTPRLCCFRVTRFLEKPQEGLTASRLASVVFHCLRRDSLPLLSHFLGLRPPAGAAAGSFGHFWVCESGVGGVRGVT